MMRYEDRCLPLTASLNKFPTSLFVCFFICKTRNVIHLHPGLLGRDTDVKNIDYWLLELKKRDFCAFKQAKKHGRGHRPECRQNCLGGEGVSLDKLFAFSGSQFP